MVPPPSTISLPGIAKIAIAWPRKEGELAVADVTVRLYVSTSTDERLPQTEPPRNPALRGPYCGSWPEQWPVVGDCHDGVVRDAGHRERIVPSHAPRPKATSIDVPTSAQAELDRIIDELAHLGFALPGTITRRMTRCGKPSCRCQADQDPRLHGPYIQWTRAVKAKTITKTLSPPTPDLPALDRQQPPPTTAHQRPAHPHPQHHPNHRRMGGPKLTEKRETRVQRELIAPKSVRSTTDLAARSACSPAISSPPSPQPK
jgi:hypothetical protein